MKSYAFHFRAEESEISAGLPHSFVHLLHVAYGLLYESMQGWHMDVRQFIDNSRRLNLRAQTLPGGGEMTGGIRFSPKIGNLNLR